MAMRILFLDVDGVLNSTRTYIASGGYPKFLHQRQGFDWVAIKLLQRFCDSSGVQIVLSSDWRGSFTAKEVGTAFGLPIIDSTPVLVEEIRGVEIKAWLDAHPDVEVYAILEDEAEMLPEQESRVVRTDPQEGMTWRDFSRLCPLFGENPFSGQARDDAWVQQIGWM